MKSRKKRILDRQAAKKVGWQAAKLAILREDTAAADRQLAEIFCIEHLDDAAAALLSRPREGDNVTVDVYARSSVADDMIDGRVADLPTVDVTFRRTEAGWEFSGWIAWIIGELTLGGTADEETALLASAKGLATLRTLMLRAVRQSAPSVHARLVSLVVDRGHRHENNLRTFVRLELAHSAPTPVTTPAADLVAWHRDLASIPAMATMAAKMVDPTGTIGEMRRQRDQMRALTAGVSDPLRAMAIDVTRAITFDPVRAAISAFPRDMLKEAAQLPLAVREMRRLQEMLTAVPDALKPPTTD